MIDHVCLEVTDLERSARFYDALFFAVGVRRLAASEAAIAYGIDHPSFWIRLGSRPAGGGHVAIVARGRAAVDAAYEAALAAGGRDDGEPAPRPQNGASCYAARLRDPDGSRVEMVSGGRG